jgi:hypothetical protein
LIEFGDDHRPVLAFGSRGLKMQQCPICKASAEIITKGFDQRAHWARELVVALRDARTNPTFLFFFFCPLPPTTDFTKFEYLNSNQDRDQ